MKMPWESTIENASKLISEFITDPDKQAEMTTRTIEAMLNSRTTKFVDAAVKLAYASNMLVKGLVRPLFSAGIFLYALFNPEILKTLHDLGTVGDIGITAMFSAGPLWGYSRHVEKTKKKRSSQDDDPIFDED